MVHRILLPLDGSSRSERAIPVADGFAEALGAEVHLLRVVDPGEIITTSTSRITPGVVETREQLAAEYVSNAAKRFHFAARVSTEVVRGNVSELILERARTGRFDLVIMSSQGQSGLMGVLLGSVAWTVVRESSVPVLILRERVALPWRPRGLDVLVPLDGTEIADAVLVPLMPLAHALDWRLTLLWVADVPDHDVPDDGNARTELARRRGPAIVAHLENVATRIQRSGVRARPLLDCGDPAGSIVQCAENEHVGLIAMTTHSRRGIGRLVVGSVTERVLRGSSKPVLASCPRLSSSLVTEGIGGAREGGQR